MYKIKKGFTISEIIIYLGITSLVLALPTSFMIIKERGYELKVENEVNAVHDFLMKSKQFSRKYNSIGEIIFDNLENELIYQNTIKTCSLKLESVKVMNNMNNIISVSDMGMFKEAGTITIIDKNNKQKEITIVPAVWKINIK